MTAPVRSTPSLSIPQSQNTAPVLEFNCLYTHDVRRKQKRWQDGFLRYHTFNKRVMVYDVPRNFLGDMHWTQGADLQEGDEMTLEKTGIVVQVAEEVGRTETDLSELLHRRDKPSPSKGASSPYPSLPQRLTPKAHTSLTPVQTKHRSLNSLLGPSRGPIGKVAVPARSPFEERNKVVDAQEWESGREPKRAKTESWNVTRTTKTVKPARAATTALARPRSENAPTSKSNQPIVTQRRLNVTEIIDISSDNEHSPAVSKRHYVEQDQLLSTPFHLLGKSTTKSKSGGENNTSLAEPRTVHADVAVSDDGVGKSPSIRQMQRKQVPPPVEPRVAKRARQRTSPQPMPATSGSVQNRFIQANKRAPSESVEVPEAQCSATDRDSQKQGRALRLAASAPRKMLVFQNQTSKLSAQGQVRKAEKDGSFRRPRQAENGRVDPAGQDVTLWEPCSEAEPQKTPPSIHRQRLQERLARISKKQSAALDEPKLNEDPRPSTNIAQSGSDASLTSVVGISRSRRSSTSSVEDPDATSAIREDSRKLSKSSHFLHPGAREISPKDKDRREQPKQPSPKAPSSSPPVTKAMVSNLMPPPPPPPARPSTSVRRTAASHKRLQGPAAVVLGREFKAPAMRAKPAATKILTSLVVKAKKENDLDSGPWSKEAFDLMDWRPPNLKARDETEGESMEIDSG